MEKRGWGTRISRRKVFISQCRKNTLGNPFVFHYFWVSTNLMLQRVKSRFSVENVLSQSAEKFVGDPFSF